VVIPTGVCAECGIRVPVLRRGIAAKHWARRTPLPHARLGRMLPACTGGGRPARHIEIVMV
jgi:hypothetical protein